MPRWLNPWPWRRPTSEVVAAVAVTPAAKAVATEAAGVAVAAVVAAVTMAKGVAHEALAAAAKVVTVEMDAVRGCG